MSVTTKVRRLVYDRDDHRCIHCGTTTGLSIQHRANAGMGGSKSRHRVENLLTMCLESNQRLEVDADFARTGLYKGWKLKSWENPLAVPVSYPDGMFLLTGSGNRTPYKEK